MIPYGLHYIDEEDICAVVDVLRNTQLTQGPKVAEFEQAIAEYTGAKYAVAVSSGTAALHLTCIAADLGPGDEVITSANTFVASANCALYVGAKPVFADIDPDTLNIDTDDLQRRIATASNIKTIIPVHFAGLPCDMAAIYDIAQQHNVNVIEDASHALGASYADGSRVGNCQFSDMTVFSLHPVKGVTSGEGGLITTNDKHLYKRLLKLRSHGIYKCDLEFSGSSVHNDIFMNPERALLGQDVMPWYYEMQELGYNYRITDIQCALALSQLKKIELFLQRRREIAASYDESFQKLNGVRCTQVEGRGSSSHHIYVLRIDFEGMGISRHQFMNKLFEQGVGSQVHYIPVPMHPYYENLGMDISNYSETESYYNEALTIPIYYGLSDKQVNVVTDAVKNVIDS